MFNHRSRDRFASIHPNRRQFMQVAAGGIAAATAISPFARPAASQDNAITIDFWNWWDVGRQPLMDKIIEGFHVDFPIITVNSVPQTWDRRDEVVITALSGGKPPQVIMATRQEIVNFADSGALAPIDAYVDMQKLDLARYYDSEIASMWWKDQLYALPMPTAGGETSLYFYNTTLFQEAGLNPEKPPTTWDELDAAAEKLTKRSSDGAIEQMGVNLAVDHTTFLAQLYCDNGTLYSDDLKNVTFNSDKGVETLQWMLDFVNKHFGGQQNVLDWLATINTGEDSFHQQRLAIQFQNVSQFFHLKDKAPDVKYNVGFRPYNGNNPDAKSQGIAGLSFGWGYVIPKGLNPEVEEAAFDWVKRITYDDQGACTFMLEQERPSPLIDCNERPEFAQNNPHWDKVQQAMQNDIAVGIVPVQAEILATLQNYVEMVGFDEMSVEEALDAAAEEAQATLDDYWSNAS